MEKMITLTKQSSPSIAVGKAGQWYTLLFTTSVSRPTGHAGWMENFINSNRIPGAREDRDWRASSHWGCRKYPSPPPLPLSSFCIGTDYFSVGLAQGDARHTLPLSVPFLFFIYFGGGDGIPCRPAVSVFD